MKSFELWAKRCVRALSGAVRHLEEELGLGRSYEGWANGQAFRAIRGRGALRWCFSADEVERAVPTRTETDDGKVIVIRPRALPTRSIEDRECLTVSQREVLVRPLAPELQRPREVLIFQWLAPHAPVEQSGHQFITPARADFASEEQPQFSEDGIDRPYLLTTATYVDFDTHSVEVLRIISDEKREQRARVSE
jgi:hypothetical protein